MGEGVFPLIPSIYVDNSLLTAVLVGVLVLFALGERFGWPQSGLVVPGYLAGILVVAPEIAGLIGIEAVATYLLARLLIHGLSRAGVTDRAFGRDRFFLILVLSVLVRLFFEAGPGGSLVSAFGLGGGSSLYSVGLVLVPLTANALWMPGLLRGVPLVGLPILAVYALLVTVLIPYTNLNLSHLAFSTEEWSKDFLSTPKDYIVLLCATAIATRMNLRFGWEFGGILLPGLLAIAWTEPSKVLATLVEVLVMAGVLSVLLRATPLKRVNLSGLRPLVLAFTVAYALKLVLAWKLGEAYPGLRASDLFGFGYLLPSLLVVRCWKRGSLPRILVPTVLTSAAGFLLGTLIAAGLNGFESSSPKASIQQSNQLINEPAWEALVVGAVPTQSKTALSPAELQDAVELLESNQGAQSDSLRIQRHPDGLLLTGMGDEALGRTWYRPDASSSVAIVALQAGQVPGAPEASVGLARLLDARVAALSPPSRWVEALSQSHDVLHLSVGDTSQLKVNGALPQTLDLKAIRALLPALEVFWTDDGEHLELELRQEDLLLLALRHFSAKPQSGRGDLSDPLATPDRSVPPSPDHLATLSRGVIQPLVLAQTQDARWGEIAGWHAKRLGLQMWEDEDTFSLSTSPFGAPPHWALWLRKGGGDTAIEVPTAGRHYRTVRVGKSWWEATQATALLVHNAKADVDIYQSQRDGLQSNEAAILRALTLEMPELKVLSVNAFLQYENPGVDAVLSDGRPSLGVEDPTPIETLAAQLVARSGGNSRVYSAAPAELRLHDSQNARRLAVETAGGAYLSVYLSPTFRLRFGGLSDSPTLSATLAALGLPVEQHDFSPELLNGIEDTESLKAPFVELLQSLERYGSTGHPGELARIKHVARQRGLSLAIWVESPDGIPYLQAQSRTSALLIPLSNYQPRPAGATFDDLRIDGRPLYWRTR